MKTLKEYNEDKVKQYKEAKAKAHLSGIACDKCGTELEFPNPGELLMSNPPKKRVKCPKCGHTDYVYA